MSEVVLALAVRGALVQQRDFTEQFAGLEQAQAPVARARGVHDLDLARFDDVRTVAFFPFGEDGLVFGEMLSIELVQYYGIFAIACR